MSLNIYSCLKNHDISPEFGVFSSMCVITVLYVTFLVKVERDDSIAGSWEAVEDLVNTMLLITSEMDIKDSTHLLSCFVIACAFDLKRVPPSAEILPGWRQRYTLQLCVCEFMSVNRFHFFILIIGSCKCVSESEHTSLSRSLYFQHLKS